MTTQTAPTVRLFKKEREIIPTEVNTFFNRHLRRTLDKIKGQQIKAFGHLVHPESGERPQIWLVVKDVLTAQVEVRLVTDSEPLRAWLKEKGAPIGELIQKEGVDAPVIHEKQSDAA